MKLHIVTCNLTAGTSNELQAVFKSKKRARQFVERKFRTTPLDGWDEETPDCLECHDKEGSWIGYVKITTIETANLKY